MNIYIYKKQRIKTHLAKAEVRKRLQELLKKEDDSKSIVSKLGFSPQYKGHVGKERFNLSPIYHGFRFFSGTYSSTLFNIEGEINQKNNYVLINIDMGVNDIIQKLTGIVFLFAVILSSILLFGNQSSYLMFFLLFMVLGFYIFYSISAFIGYKMSTALLKKVLNASR